MYPTGTHSLTHLFNKFLIITQQHRSDILSSIGLTEDIEKSIQHFHQEKTELLQQMSSIKDSFEVKFFYLTVQFVQYSLLRRMKEKLVA